MIARGERKWLLRVFLGRDALGRKKYASRTIAGTTTQARQELTKMLREADTESLVRPTQLTLAQYIDQWYKTKMQVSESTLGGYKLQLGLDILPYLGHLRLHDHSARRAGHDQQAARRGAGTAHHRNTHTPFSLGTQEGR